MSTATTPVPSSFDKRPLVVGLGVVGLVTAGVLVAQNVTSLSLGTSTTTTSVNPLAGGPDALEAQARSALVRAGGPDALEAQNAAIDAAKIQQQLDQLAKLKGNYAARFAAVVVGASVIRSQVGGMHQSYAWTGSTGRMTGELSAQEKAVDHMAKTQGNYAGQLAPYGVDQSVVESQVGGMHPSSAFTGKTGVITSLEISQVGGLRPTFPYTPSGTGSHTVWNDTHVPPYQDPAWAPFIQKHYFGARSGE